MASEQRPSGTSTLADLEAIPGGDGKRYELIDGHILVTPWPAHYGGVSFRLGPLLAKAVPPEHASYRLCGLDLPNDGRVIPDLMIAPHSSVGSQRVHTPVLLVVEVLCGAPESDRALKHAAFAAAEIPALWVIDPEAPLATCLRLEDGQYVPYAEGPELEVDWPLAAAVTVNVAELARPQESTVARPPAGD